MPSSPEERNNILPESNRTISIAHGPMLLSLDYDEIMREYRATVSTDCPSVTHAIADSVASILGEDPCDIPPLAETVDPDALNQLFRDSPLSSQGRRLTFTYESFEVTVSSNGTLRLRR